MPKQVHALNRFRFYKPEHLNKGLMLDGNASWSGFNSLYQGRKMSLQDYSFLDYFDEAANHYPASPAISMEGCSLNYAELSFSINALARWFLEASTIKPGDRVALYLPNSLSYMVAILAAWRAQLVVANLSFLPEADCTLQQLQDSGAKILVTIPAFLPKVEKMLLQTSIRHIITTHSDDYVDVLGRIKTWLSPRKWISQWREDNTVIRYVRLRQIFNKTVEKYQEWPRVKPDDLAMIQYTSGTTDAPVGAALSHRNLSSNYQQVKQILNDVVGPEKCGLCPVALQHIAGVSFCLMLLSSAAHVVLSRPVELLHKSRHLQKHQFDLMTGMPCLYAQILQHEASRQLAKKMQLFICWGNFASRTLQQEWHALSGRYLCEAYGLSETAPLISINPPQRIRPATVGVILPNTEVCVVSSTQKPLGFNQPGELWVRGPQVMRGYWHQPVATRQAMTYDEWFKTGDIVSISEDGFISMLEREADTFWWKGQRMFPHQIEQQIYQHEEVLDCTIVQERDDPAAPVRLMVVAKKGLTPEQLKAFIASRLHSGFLPGSIEFVDHLPRGPMGKVFRRLLRLRDGACAQSAPDRGRDSDPADQPS